MLVTSARTRARSSGGESRSSTSISRSMADQKAAPCAEDAVFAPGDDLIDQVHAVLPAETDQAQ